MVVKEIREVYNEIFKSYDNPSLEQHIAKIIELDQFLPYNSTFFCITNTQTFSFEYVSKNCVPCLGYAKGILKDKGMHFLWEMMHPDDIDCWLTALKSLMEFTLGNVDLVQRKRMSYTWNYRLKHAGGYYVNVIQNTTPLELDSENKPIIGLAHYTIITSQIQLPVTATAKLLNDKDEYETLYFNNFSQKLLTDGITNRERDIIRLLALRQSSKAIAEKLSISPNTVDTHRRNILKKFNIGSTGELVAILKLNGTMF